VIFALDLHLRENGRFNVVCWFNQCRGAILISVFLMWALWQSKSTLKSFAPVVGKCF